MNRKTLIIIPAYNEQENILDTISDLQYNYPEGDVLVVNDCSNDNTLRILIERKINYLKFSNNLGIGGAVQAGYIYARDLGYDFAVQFDGDGQHMAVYLHDLIDVLRKNEADIVIGSRFLKKEGFQSTYARRMGIDFLSGMIRLLCGVKVLDVTSGMRAVNQRFINEFAEHYAQDYPEPESLLYAGLAGAVIKEIPVQMRERKHGTSSISPIRSAYYMFKVSLALFLEWLISKNLFGDKKK